ncbi:uracil-DNA glycosylase [Spirochaetia bacterium]|nr:uracil-DNA glycosylase [Spirochaetia bacterium]
MKSEQKKALAHFLDISKAFIGSRYDFSPAQYEFEDDVDEPSVAAVEAVSMDSAVKTSTAPEQERRDYKAELSAIAQDVRACTGCRLCEKRKNAVPGEGVPRPLVLVLGEGPGADEDASGRPFVGKAGQLLDKMLLSIGMSREKNCFIANVVKCRPPENRDPLPDETGACNHFLERQIDLLKPLAILSVGRIPTKTLLRTEEGITKLRGVWKDYKGTPFLPTFHPSYLLRDESQKPAAWEDLKSLCRKIAQLDSVYAAQTEDLRKNRNI